MTKLRIDGNTVTESKFVAVGHNGSNQPAYSISTDGITWTTPSLMNDSTEYAMMTSVAVSSKGQFVAFGTNSTNQPVFTTSTDGINWSTPTLINGYNTTNTLINSVTVNSSGRFVAIGYDGNLNPIFTTSTNGIDWTTPALVNGYTGFAQLLCITVNSSGRFVAIGYDGGLNPIFTTSTDGTTWTTPSLMNGYTGITFIYSVTVNSSGRFVGIGYNGTNQPVFATSTDGTTWSTPSLMNGYTGSAQIFSVTVNSSGRFVAVGYNGSSQPVFATSTDGTTWSTPSLMNGYTGSTFIYSVTVNSSGKFVATGYNNLSLHPVVTTSTDGINWTTPTSHHTGFGFQFSNTAVTYIERVVDNVIEVNSDNEVKISLSKVPANIGGVRMFSENDASSNYLKSPETSSDFRLRKGLDTILFHENFNYTAQDTWKWYYASTTMTASLPASGFLQLGTVAGTAISHGAEVISYQNFPIVNSSPLALQCSFAQITSQILVNEIFDIGFRQLPTSSLGISATAPENTILLDGVFLRLTSSGLEGIVRNNGLSVSTGIMKSSKDFIINKFETYTIVVDINFVEFWMNNILIGIIKVPPSMGAVFLAASTKVFIRKLCTGTTSSTNKMGISWLTVLAVDLMRNKPLSEIQCGQGLTSYNFLPGAAVTTKNGLYPATAVAPTPAALTNSTVLAATLTGMVSINPTLATTTDGIINGYQNPLYSTANTVHNRNLYITGVSFQGIVVTALTGGPVTYNYSIAYGHTAVSLATADAASFINATTHAPKIIPIGSETYPATAAVGVLGKTSPTTVIFDTPLCVGPGECIGLIARNRGTVTTLGAITFIFQFNGYYE